MTPDIDAQLKTLADELPELRRQHPDDFWNVFHARAEAITAAVQSKEDAAQVTKRIDDMLAANQLGPADPGAWHRWCNAHSLRRCVMDTDRRCCGDLHLQREMQAETGLATLRA